MGAEHVIVNDLGLREIAREMKAADGIRTTIGIQGTEASADHNGISNANLGAVHEFGASIDHPGGTAFYPGEGFISNASATPDMPRTGPHRIEIPQRSFLGSTFDINRGTYERMIDDGVGRAIDEKTSPRNAFALTGEKYLADVRNAINSGIAPALKQATIDRKRSSKPLVDTGQLKGALTTKTEAR